MYLLKEMLYSGGMVFAKLEYSGDADDGEKTVRFSVAKEFFKPFGLKEGDEVDDDVLIALADASKLTEAVKKALDAVSYSNHSARSLEMKLRTRYGIDEDFARDAVEYCVGRGFIDEKKQAELFAESSVKRKNWGARRIAGELYAKGYPKEVSVEAAKSISKELYDEALTKLIKKKLRAYPSDRKEYSKAVSSLVRLGHSPSDISASLHKVFDEDGEENID